MIKEILKWVVGITVGLTVAAIIAFCTWSFFDALI
jgi:hypothetical protein